MIGSKFTLTAVILAMLCIENSVAFQVSQPSCGNTRRLRRKGYFELRSDRRVFIETVSTITAVSILSINPNIALASGGATAGGAYLLSAKQRYNDRVKAGARSFVALGATIEGGDLDAFRSYFSQEDVGNWKDLSTAGYLLANAFRRNSTAAPDSLPSVKVRIPNRLKPFQVLLKLNSCLFNAEMESLCGSS